MGLMKIPMYRAYIDRSTTPIWPRGDEITAVYQSYQVHHALEEQVAAG